MRASFFITFSVIAVIAIATEELPPDCSRFHYSPWSVHKYVCGSDGVTYANLEHLQFSSCMNRQNVTVVKEGYCDEEEGKRAAEAHRQFMANYAKQIRKAIKEGRPIPYIADAPMPNLDDYPEEEDEVVDVKN